MKLWRHTRKRVAMQCIGSQRNYRRLLLASKLKIGDLIHTCEGINAPIKSIEPEFWRTGEKGLVIRDFDIETEGGGCCSFMHCCTLPLLSKIDIETYFRSWATPKNRKYAEKCGMVAVVLIADAIVRGEDLLDERGVPNARYLELREEGRSKTTPKRVESPEDF